MEQSNNIKRSELWNEIHNIVKQIPREKIVFDSPDATSAATELEELFWKNLSLTNVRHSFSCYVVFEILDAGLFSMTLTAKKEKKKVHEFKTESEAAQWIIENADDFRRYFIMKQISVR